MEKPATLAATSSRLSAPRLRSACCVGATTEKKRKDGRQRRQEVSVLGDGLIRNPLNCAPFCPGECIVNLL